MWSGVESGRVAAFYEDYTRDKDLGVTLNPLDLPGLIRAGNISVVLRGRGRPFSHRTRGSNCATVPVLPDGLFATMKFASEIDDLPTLHERSMRLEICHADTHSHTTYNHP